MAVEAPVKGTLNIIVMDAMGRVVKTQKAFVEAGSNTLLVDAAGLAQGSYLIRLQNEADRQTAVGKFVKE